MSSSFSLPGGDLPSNRNKIRTIVKALKKGSRGYHHILAISQESLDFKPFRAYICEIRNLYFEYLLLTMFSDSLVCFVIFCHFLVNLIFLCRHCLKCQIEQFFKLPAELVCAALNDFSRAACRKTLVLELLF